MVSEIIYCLMTIRFVASALLLRRFRGIFVLDSEHQKLMYYSEVRADVRLPSIQCDTVSLLLVFLL